MQMKSVKEMCGVMLLLLTTASFAQNVVPPNQKVFKDGVYIVGKSAPVGEFEKGSQLLNVQNETTGKKSSILFSGWIYLNNSAEGFNIVTLKNGNKTIYGPSEDFKKVTVSLYDEPVPQTDFLRGLIKTTSTPFTVSKSGLFFFGLDTLSKKMVLTPITHINLAGTVSQSGWWNDPYYILFPKVEENGKKVIYSISNYTFTRGRYKIRFSDSWKLTVDTITHADGTQEIMKVNTNWGGDENYLNYGGTNILSSKHGIFDISVVFKVGELPYVEFKKVGSYPMVDYSSHFMGICGTGAFYLSDGVTLSQNDTNWGGPNDTKTPSTKENVYTWKWENVSLVYGGSFEFRQDNTWDAKIIGYDFITWSGDGMSDFRSADEKLRL